MNIERPKTVMILGKGGREAALQWKLRQSPLVGNIMNTPSSLDLSNTDHVIQYAKDTNPDMIIVGPEELLVAGIVDAVQRIGIDIFGPTRAAAIEGSKTDQILFMQRHGIPHPRSVLFDRFDNARRFAANPLWVDRTDHYGLVVKADGLCKGKGVFVCSTYDEANEAIECLMVKEEFGEAGKRVVIQEKLEGVEVSCMALVDGERFLLLPFSEDYKQLFDGDCGPNTGGMGSVAPHPFLADRPELQDEILNKILRPTIAGLAHEGRPFRGCLYPGMMVTVDGPKVLEYNVRFGDPETEAVLPIISEDIFGPIAAIAAGQRLQMSRAAWYRPEVCVVVAMASSGYPEHPRGGDLIEGLDLAEKVYSAIVFHAGMTQNAANQWITDGGRVLMVAGRGRDIPSARANAMNAVGEIRFANMQFRRDIGLRRSKWHSK
ncbi:MAG: phosphoribosylamine--glycine ligase [bacterium]|nr:phosphoribosylamine--glycine ligase [bacterium]